jgi:hypothetical protein
LAVVTAGASGGFALFNHAAAGTSGIGGDRFLKRRLSRHKINPSVTGCNHAKPCSQGESQGGNPKKCKADREKGILKDLLIVYMYYNGLTFLIYGESLC